MNENKLWSDHKNMKRLTENFRRFAEGEDFISGEKKDPILEDLILKEIKSYLTEAEKPLTPEEEKALVTNISQKNRWPKPLVAGVLAALLASGAAFVSQKGPAYMAGQQAQQDQEQAIQYDKTLTDINLMKDQIEDLEKQKRNTTDSTEKQKLQTQIDYLQTEVEGFTDAGFMQRPRKKIDRRLPSQRNRQGN